MLTGRQRATNKRKLTIRIKNIAKLFKHKYKKNKYK